MDSFKKSFLLQTKFARKSDNCMEWQGKQKAYPQQTLKPTVSMIKN